MAPKRKSTDAKAAETSDPAIEEKAAAPKKAKAGSKLAIGDNVSKVTNTLLTNDEKEVTLSELTKDKGIIIFTYPRAATPGCTKQACGFRDNYKKITDVNFDVFGMSFDKPKSQTSWKVKQSLPYSLLTDADGIALKAFGAFKLPKNVIRSHFIIAKGGEVLDIRNQISPIDSFNEAVKFVTELKK
jgi:thioredoxin-dependent peroxiredoxin